MHGVKRRAEIVVGARGSMLSVLQTESVIAQLRALAPEQEFVLKKITTLGDRKAEWSRADTGIFVKELEEALARDEIDIAVHSVKDMPSRLPEGLQLAAIPRREDPRDMLITANGTDLAGLPADARLGTSSLRRRAQLLRLRPTLRIEGLRGNLDSRIRKLREGRYDAIVVAAAGVRRLDVRDIHYQLLSHETVLPAPGQGALGLEIRSDDTLRQTLVAGIDDRVTHVCVACEREFLHRTQAGCRMPVAALAAVDKDTITLDAMIISLDGQKAVRVQQQSRLDQSSALAGAQQLGAAVAQQLLARGGARILEEIRHAQE
ncbi:MAG TPA: hydroxymethylbilane synthase [Candidatus Omnitrophota bacterium]|nr:hydroxymethylbilane synthase [Candidatus Omnitrophota bacterium]